MIYLHCHMIYLHCHMIYLHCRMIYNHHMIYLHCHMIYKHLSHDLLTTISWSTYSCPSCSLWQSPDSTPWTPGSVVSPPWSGQGTWPLGDWPTLSAPGSGHPRTPHAPPALTSSFRSSISLLEYRLLSKMTGKNKTPPKCDSQTKGMFHYYFTWPKYLK